MIAALLIALAASTPAPDATVPDRASLVKEAAHAISAGRLDQARLMIGRAVAAGASGPPVDRLLADVAFASRDYAGALSLYQRLRRANPTDSSVCEQGGIAALKMDQLGEAETMIRCATAAPSATWRSWNARAVLADLMGDWAAADAAYDWAAQIAPNEPEIINNQGWSQLLRGDWVRAVDCFERAAALDPASNRIADNLELARAALQRDLPRRRPGESDRSFAERLNDAGVAAQLLGDRQRAVAAFTQALEASDTWYSRAANNLEALGKP